MGYDGYGRFIWHKELTKSVWYKILFGLIFNIETYIQNWKPISLLNVDAKLISKVLAMRLKKVIDKVIRPDQTAYIPGRFIGESIRLISDILEYTEVEQMEGYMFAADIEKAFDSVDHNFLIAVLKKFGLGHEFIQWVKTLLYDQQSCVMINGHSTGYFALKRGSRQGDPLSVFFFLLTIEVLFIMIRSNVNIKGLNIFENEIKFTACADDTTLFLRDLNSFFELLSLFQIFESWSSLKLNLNKSELCGIGVKEGVNLAFCGCKVVNLDKETGRFWELILVIICHLWIQEILWKLFPKWRKYCQSGHIEL